MAVRYIKDGEERTRWGGGKRNEVNLYGGKGRRGEVVKTKKETGWERAERTPTTQLHSIHYKRTTARNNA